MNTTETAQPNHDERVLAALAHAGAALNLLNLAGLFGAALIWTSQRERSVYVRRHAGQALAFQLLALLVGSGLLLVWGGCLGFTLLPLLLRPELYADSWPTLFWFTLTVGFVPLLFGLGTLGYGLIGAWCAYRNLPFRYPLVHRLFAVSTAAATPTTPAPPPPAEEPPTAPASGAA